MTPTEEQGGFDLERARGLRDFLQDDCAEVGDVWGEMIAEIERLRASLTDLHAEYINTLEKNPGCSAWDLDEQSIEDQRRLRRNAAHAISIVEPPIYLQADQQATKILELEAISRRRNEIINKQVAKIKELKADLEQSERVIESRLDVIEAQAIQIKALERDSIRLASKIRELEAENEEAQEMAARIKELEAGWAKEKAQNLLNFQRHDEGETRSWDDLSEDQQQARIEFADRCIRAESKIAELNTSPDGEDDI